MTNPEKVWIGRPRDREISIALLLIGALGLVIGYFFAGIAGMAYRTSWVQTAGLIVMGFGPFPVYLVGLILTIRALRARKRAWRLALFSWLGAVAMWLLGLGIVFAATAIVSG